MGDELVDMMAKPGAMFDNALSNFTKKTATTFFGKFKRQLSTASEPFFRKEMGERYFGGENLVGGAAIWFGVTCFVLMFPSFRSTTTPIFNLMGLYGIGQLFHHWMTVFLVGGALVFFHVKFGMESLAAMRKYRAEGTAYHTQSRGIPRWGRNNIYAGIAIALVLFVFIPPAGLLFVISCAASAKLASEQEAAIYSRYLDALDQKIEQEYLENAILGKCPTEITQLRKPLPLDMNSELRNNIAAAAVGKPVKIVAKAPNAAAGTVSGEFVAQS
jgi:hypothetical protein